MVGVSRNTISSIENGLFNPTAKLALICILHEINNLKKHSILMSRKSIYRRCLTYFQAMLTRIYKSLLHTNTY